MSAIAGSLLLLACSCLDSSLDHYNRGVKYQQAGQLYLAEFEFQFALQKNPNFVEAHLKLGQLHLYRGWYGSAEWSTRTAIDLLSRNQSSNVMNAETREAIALAHNNLGEINIARATENLLDRDHDMTGHFWKSAMRHFKYAVAIDPQHSVANNNLRIYANFLDTFIVSNYKCAID